MNRPLPPHDFANLKPDDLRAVRQALCEYSVNIIAFSAMLNKLVKTALNESDAMLLQEIINLADAIQLADPVFDVLQQREDERQHDATVQSMAPARPPLKRGRGMVKVVTSQRFPTETPGDVFDALPSTIVKRPSYIQEDDPDDDEIPF